MPQWSPTVEAGKSRGAASEREPDGVPQWSPVVEAGKSGSRPAVRCGCDDAAMEPGRGGREEGSRPDADLTTELGSFGERWVLVRVLVGPGSWVVDARIRSDKEASGPACGARHWSAR